MLLLPARVAILVVAALFAVSVGVKTKRLLAGEVASEPLLRLGLIPRRLATPLLAAALSLEIVTICGLLFYPMMSIPLACALMLFYAFLLSRLPAHERCGCLGDVAPMSNRLALWRNIILAGVLGLIGVIGTQRELERGLLTQKTAGISLVVLAVFVVVARASGSGVSVTSRSPSHI
jgi:hypothetical protein